MKYLSRIVLIFIGLLWVLALTAGLQGCTQKDYPPARKSLVVIEKSPFRIIYVDKEAINEPLVRDMMNLVSKHPYYAQPFNPDTNLGFNMSGHQSDSESDEDHRSSSHSATVSRTMPNP